MLTHRHVKLLIVTIISLVVMATLFPVLATTAKPVSQDFAANIQPLGGLVQQFQADKGTWQTLSKVTLLKAGDQIRTGDVGAALLSTTTGVKMNIYPNTIVGLSSLSLGTDDNSALTFIVTQTAGITYTDVGRTLKKGDNVQIITPAFIGTVQGTKFFTFVSRSGYGSIIGDENNVKIVAINPPPQTNQPNNIAYFGQPLTSDAPVVCTTQILGNNKGAVIRELTASSSKQLYRDFLTDFLKSNVNSTDSKFLDGVVGLPDGTAIKDLLDGIAKFDKTPDLTAFLKDFRGELNDYFTAQSAVPLVPETCGNGQKDSGETTANCKADTADLTSTCGNGMCETDLGESVVNCPVDCLPYGTLLQSCVDTLNTSINNGNNGGNNGGGGNGGGGGPVVVTATPVPSSTATTNPGTGPTSNPPGPTLTPSATFTASATSTASSTPGPIVTTPAPSGAGS